MLLEIALDIQTGAGLAFEQNQREFRDLLHGIRMVEVAVIVRRGDKDGMRVHAVAHAVDLRVLLFACKGDIHLTAAQIVEHHPARAVQDADADVRICLVERLQTRDEICFGHGVARADDQLTGQQLPRLRQLFLSVLDQPQRARYILEKRPPFRGQHHAARAPGEQAHLKLLLELLDRLADRGLGNIQILRRCGDIAHLGYLLKHTVKLQFDCHFSLHKSS